MGLIKRILDPRQAPVVVAELSGNHKQSIKRAKELVSAAAASGADAVKLQTYTADSLTLDSDRPEFVVRGGLWHGRRLYELYKEASTPYSWHAPLQQHAASLGMELFSTPFDEAAVDYLEAQIDPVAHKISSFELTHTPLLRRTGQTRKPVLLSTGMATESEIRDAVRTLRSNGCPLVALLKCVSAYPSQASGFNLRSMQTLRDSFECPVGLSDHSLGNEVAIASVALGARVVEKHLTLSRAEGGVDSGFSLEPSEFGSLVQSVGACHSALGDATIGASAQDEGQKRHRRSIYAAEDIGAGEAFTPRNIRIVRPSLGLDPRHWDSLLGRSAKRAIKEGTPLSKSDL